MWGLIGAATILTGGAAAEAAVGVAAFKAFLSLAGSGAAAGISFFDPNGAVNAEADELKQQMRESFCASKRFVDASLTQIVQDYGLLTANRQLLEATGKLTPTVLDNMEADLTNGQNLWIWQQFGNKETGSNLWIGWCDFGDAAQGSGDDCSWTKEASNTWSAPENPDVVYRLVGEKVGSQGPFANCNYDVFGDDDNAGLRDLYFGTNKVGSPLSFISPRQTDTAVGAGRGRPYSVPALDEVVPNNIGVLGWRLGTERCE